MLKAPQTCACQGWGTATFHPSQDVAGWAELALRG